MIGRLRQAVEAGTLRPLDLHFALCLAQLVGEEAPGLILGAALVSQRSGEGDVCVALSDYAGKPLFADRSAGFDGVQAPVSGDWIAALERSGAVAGPEGFAPLILDRAGRLYLGRFWWFERDLAADLLRRAAPVLRPPPPGAVRAVLDRLFPGPADAKSPDWQKIAAAVAAFRRLTVVSGGPGTGKTRTVAAILALVIELARPARPRIALAAPTGKAAARLGESIEAALARLDCPTEVREAVPRDVSTLHRLLGAVPGGVGYRQGPDNPLHVDLVVVDEASMVDLPLMSRLLRALPPDAGLLLLGDKDQLASVEAGYVLGDLCGAPWLPAFSPAFVRLLREATGEAISGDGDSGGDPSPLGDSVVLLRRSFRFSAEGGVGALAAAVNAGEAERVLALLADPALREVAREEPSAGDLPRLIRNRVAPAYRVLFETRDPVEGLRALGRLRVLCALREGPFGVARLNALIETVLREQGLIRHRGPWYPGRPVMVTRNDYGLGLFNGDLGIAMPDSDGRLRVWLPGPGGSIRALAPGRLGPHETVFAMTVHKSQGSELDEVILVLPDLDNPLIGRELLYTAITRARARFTVWSQARCLREAVLRRGVRLSALRERLWGPGSGPT